MFTEVHLVSYSGDIKGDSLKWLLVARLDHWSFRLKKEKMSQIKSVGLRIPKDLSDHSD